MRRLAVRCLVLTSTLLAGCVCQRLEMLCLEPQTPIRPIDVEARTILSAETMPKTDPPAKPEQPSGKEPLVIPPELPGADAPPVRLPDPADREAREKAMQQLFQPLPKVVAEVPLQPGPNGKPMTLPELQQLALARNPKIRQARADVEAARGQAVQAGLYPNPSVGYQADQIGAVGASGQQGAYLEQLIKTAGKLKLARLVALMDLENARVALRRAELDLINQVRAAYFSVLVARETLLVQRALVRFIDEAYRLQIAQVRAGQAAAYEPLQVYAQAVQSVDQLDRARRRYVAAWRQLSTLIGDPALPPTELAGRADAVVPDYPYEQALARVLASHTDVLTAQNSIRRAQHALRLAQVTPIPDISTQFYFQRDNTTDPAFGQVGIRAGFAVPIFDRNQGGILEAQAHLARALDDVARVRNDLTIQLAAAYERYANARAQLGRFRDHIIPTQVRVYRALRQRYQQEPEKVGFVDVLVGQRNLADMLTLYLSALSAQWEAVVEMAGLLQTDELYQLTSPETPPVVEQLTMSGSCLPQRELQERAPAVPESANNPRPGEEIQP